ncbi:hypothetical protein P9314_25690, partial [Paenibacillus validus]|nr:hypothetical protein [Paenibacillus validus]
IAAPLEERAGEAAAGEEATAEGSTSLADGSGSESGTVKAVVAASDREDIREAIFYRMAERRLPILAMKKESLSLEDIFLKLTTDEKLDDANAGSDSNSFEVAEAESEEKEVNARA